MNSQNSIPVFLFAFANDVKSSLHLGEEQNAVVNALAPLEDGGVIKVMSLGYPTLEVIYDNIERFSGRLAIFHFAGHSNSNGLRFVDTWGKSSSISTILGKESGLKLVFLNGCANQEQVELLWGAGVNAIIATSSVVEDSQALHLAERFYKSLAAGKSIKDSFDSAASFTENHTDTKIKIYRTTGALDDLLEKFPWGLYVQNDAVLKWNVGLIDTKIKLRIFQPIVNSLNKRPVLRVLFGIFGFLFLILGFLGSLLWSVPLLSWLYGFQIAIPLLIIAFFLIAPWFLSIRTTSVLTWLIGMVGIVALLGGIVAFFSQRVVGVTWLEGAVMPLIVIGVVALSITLFRKRKRRT